MKGTTRHPMNDALLAALSLEGWDSNPMTEPSDRVRDGKKLIAVLGEGGQVKTERALYQVKGGALLVVPLAD